MTRKMSSKEVKYQLSNIPASQYKWIPKYVVQVVLSSSFPPCYVPPLQADPVK